MRICLDGPDKLSSEVVDKLVDVFIATGCRIDIRKLGISDIFTRFSPFILYKLNGFVLSVHNL